MDEGRDLDDLLGYQIKRVYLLLTDRARDSIARFGITPAKATALMLLRDNPGRDQSSLARALSINRASAMKLVNTLEEIGFVERRQGRDLRSNALHLTVAGEETLTLISQALRDAEQDVAKALSVGERQVLIDLLRRVRANRSSKGAKSTL